MIPIEQAASQAEALVPPRPNLGPEPWPDRPSWATRSTSWGLAFALLFLLVLWLWRRRRSRQGRPGTSESSDALIEVDFSPRQRLIANSEKVRGALIEEFGAGWGSKTTEEIIEDARLTDRLDPGEIERLIGFLRLSDRAKFADDEPETLDDWESWAEAFVLGLATTTPQRGSALRSQI